MSILFRLPVHLRQQVQLTDMPFLNGCPLSQSSQYQAIPLSLMDAIFRLLRPCIESVLPNVLHFQPLQLESWQ